MTRRPNGTSSRVLPGSGEKATDSGGGVRTGQAEPVW